jgi:hypothetical protein
VVEPHGRAIYWIDAQIVGRSAKKKKEWLNEEAPAGTFVEKMSPEWLKREIGSKMTIELKPWRSFSTRILRWFVRPFGGRAFLRFVFWLEGVFPKRSLPRNTDSIR